MDKKIVLILTIYIIFYVIVNLSLIKTNPYTCIFNIFSFVIVCILMYRNRKELYDYERENPNALVSGKPIAGTVYSSYPNNTPGLGWIL